MEDNNEEYEEFYPEQNQDVENPNELVWRRWRHMGRI